MNRHATQFSWNSTDLKTLFRVFQFYFYNRFTRSLAVCLFLLQLMAAPAFAQDLVIQGKVSDAQNPLPGVAIKIQGVTAGGTFTDNDGHYVLKVAPGAVLVFSSIGYKPQTITVGALKTINVTLEADAKSLTEVVVVGYGTQKKVNLTGSVATVSGDDMIKRPVVNTASMLEGTMAGVQVTQSTGEPGNEGVSIRIRGNGTFSGAGSDPLVLAKT